MSRIRATATHPDPTPPTGQNSPTTLVLTAAIRLAVGHDLTGQGRLRQLLRHPDPTRLMQAARGYTAQARDALAAGDDHRRATDPTTDPAHALADALALNAIAATTLALPLRDAATGTGDTAPTTEAWALLAAIVLRLYIDARQNNTLYPLATTITDLAAELRNL